MRTTGVGGETQIGKRQLGLTAHASLDADRQGTQCLLIAGRKRQEFQWALHLTHHRLGFWCLFEDHMAIAAAEAERADTSDALSIDRLPVGELGGNYERVFIPRYVRSWLV